MPTQEQSYAVITPTGMEKMAPSKLTPSRNLICEVPVTLL
jgi:hypothetical protein